MGGPCSKAVLLGENPLLSRLWDLCTPLLSYPSNHPKTCGYPVMGAEAVIPWPVHGKEGRKDAVPSAEHRSPGSALSLFSPLLPSALLPAPLPWAGINRAVIAQGERPPPA